MVNTEEKGRDVKWEHWGGGQETLRGEVEANSPKKKKKYTADI